MGPRSTAPFVNLVIDQCMEQYGAKYDEDFPPMMIYSLPTPFYIDRPIDHNKMKEVIYKGLKKLESTGVDFIAMSCNSAHIYFDDLEKCIEIPLLNIVEETLSNLSSNSSKVTVFATESTLNSEIYQKGLMKKGLQYFSNSEMQNSVNKIIMKIKAGEDASLLQKKLLSSVKEANVDTVIFACTDLNVLKWEMEGVRFIDSSESLAKAVVNKIL